MLNLRDLPKEKLSQLSKLCKGTADFLKRSAGKKFRVLTIGKTGSKFSKEVIDVITTTDKKLRATWDFYITQIFRSLVVKISKIQVKVPLKKTISYDPSLLTDYEILDAYAITDQDAGFLMDEISLLLGSLGESLEGVLRDQQKVAYLLGLKKAKVSLDGIKPEDLEEVQKLSETDLKILERDLEFQKKHLDKFMKKLEVKYKDLLYSPPGQPPRAYGTQQELLGAVENVDTTSIHQLDMYALAAVEVAMMAGTSQPHREQKVSGGIWHTMQDGNVCPDCKDLNGTWMTWDEFYSVYKNTYCNGSCRCGELFEPCNNSTDPYSNTQGRDYYLDEQPGQKPCISSPNFPGLSMFKGTGFIKQATGAQPGSTECLLVQNSEKSAQELYGRLSKTQKKLADKFVVSSKVNFSKLAHMHTPSSAQFRNGLYRALGCIDDKVLSKINTKLMNIKLVTQKEFTGFTLTQSKKGVVAASRGFQAKKWDILIKAEASPLDIKHELLQIFGDTYYSALTPGERSAFQAWVKSCEETLEKLYISGPKNVSVKPPYAEWFAQIFSKVTPEALSVTDLKFFQSIMYQFKPKTFSTAKAVVVPIKPKIKTTPIPKKPTSQGICFTGQHLEAPMREALEYYTSTGYDVLNKALRDGVVDTLTFKQQQYIALIKQHLQVSQKSTCFSFRGLKFPDSTSFSKFMEQLKVGGTFSDDAFMSTSYHRSIVEGFLPAGDKTVLFTIKSRTGVDLSVLGLGHSVEREILFRPGTKFIIDKIKEVSPGKFEVLIFEI